jgi:hypothetical protein
MEIDTVESDTVDRTGTSKQHAALTSRKRINPLFHRTDFMR